MRSLFFGRVFRRKARTLLFLLGFAVGVASSFALLSIGKGAVTLSLQGLSSELGDGVLVPKGFQGVDLTGENPISLQLKDADFFSHIITHDPWLSGKLLAAVPRLENQTLYLRAVNSGKIQKQRKILRVLAAGMEPNQQALMGRSRHWKKLSARQTSYFCCPDPFHKPPSKSRWMEWHYFNFLVPGKMAGYVSLILYEKKGGKLEGAARFLFIKKDQAPEIFSERSGHVKILSSDSGCRIGRSFDLYKNGKYWIHLNLQKERVKVSLSYTPYLPGFPYSSTLYQGVKFGYVQPILHGFVSGRILINGKKFILNKGIGYHDHNWGKMGNVTWNWGETAQNKKDGYALSYGEIPPMKGELLLGKGKNVLAILPIKKISVLSKNGSPQSLLLAVQQKNANLRIRIALHQKKRFPYKKAAFIQALGDYSVQGKLLNHLIHFQSEGFVETFIKKRQNSTKN